MFFVVWTYARRHDAVGADLAADEALSIGVFLVIEHLADGELVLNAEEGSLSLAAEAVGPLAVAGVDRAAVPAAGHELGDVDVGGILGGGHGFCGEEGEGREGERSGSSGEAGGVCGLVASRCGAYGAGKPKFPASG